MVKYRESNPCCGVEAGALTKSVHSVRIFMAVKVNNFQNVLFIVSSKKIKRKFYMAVMLYVEKLSNILIKRRTKRTF